MKEAIDRYVEHAADTLNDAEYLYKLFIEVNFN